MERIVNFEQGYDCGRFQCINNSPACIPGKGGFHGRHGLTLRFLVKGPEGAVQFVLYTPWGPQHAVPSKIGYRECKWISADSYDTTLPADLGYHSKKPQYEGQEISRTSCEYCDGQPCYCNGSELNANDAMYCLVNGGDTALWTFLEGYYQCVFFGGPYPPVTEYPKPPRQDIQLA